MGFMLFLMPPLFLGDGKMPLFGFIVEQRTVSLVSAMSAKTCLNGIWYSMDPLMNKLLPTSTRSQAYSMVRQASGIFGALAPYGPRVADFIIPGDWPVAN